MFFGAMRIKCTNHEKGCKAVLKGLAEIKKHEKDECEFRPDAENQALSFVKAER